MSYIKHTHYARNSVIAIIEEWIEVKEQIELILILASFPTLGSAPLVWRKN